jgi:glycosyltransferase involved in cell wall biosynthesis
MATFNRAQLLPRAVASLTEQLYTAWELIVVDDGSVDDTGPLVSAWTVADGRIRYKRQENQGLTGARNTGLALAAGQFLTFLDSDDEYAPDHLLRRVEHMALHPKLDIIHGGVRIVGGPDCVPDRHNPKQLIALAQCVIGGTFFMRRCVYAEMGGFRKPDYGNDAEFMERALQRFQVGRVEFPTYIYHRETPDSMCNMMEKDCR